MALYECSLQGLVADNDLKTAVVQRLVGICGVDSMVDLFEHDIVFTPTVQTPVGPARNDDVVLRLQSRITTEQDKSLKHRQWYLSMQGHPEPQRGRNVTVRPNTRVQLGGDAFRFMKSLGYRYNVTIVLLESQTYSTHTSYSFEVVRKGHLLAYEKILRITVTQLYKVNI
ncbi:uncharacterized protein BYT42DRAFT_501923 [Radiomyces spectabilis]|uniref:uncharacterized protein n=1 Tax=Radiomyces spectabilis TaxID=64574 RepID=UPI00221FF55F|nr:uncharacterized protein BYT42DRAFT_501923 [Radiomyces spectabilis]KAI8371748.1 hypothetical protein BYT42DRAFT_501923 [Radiomyces spectabilis]